MATRQDIFDRVRRRTGILARRFENPELAVNVDHQADVDEFIVTAAREIAVQTGRLETVVTITLVEDQYEYELKNHVRQIMMATLDGVELKHSPGPDVRTAAEEQASGTPEHYGIFQNDLVVSPAPNATAAGKVLSIYFKTASAETLPADGSWNTEEEPADDLLAWLPPELEEALLLHVMHSWFDAIGEYEISDRYGERFWAAVRRHRHDPRKPQHTARKPRYF